MSVWDAATTALKNVLRSTTIHPQQLRVQERTTLTLRADVFDVRADGQRRSPRAKPLPGHPGYISTVTSWPGVAEATLPKGALVRSARVPNQPSLVLLTFSAQDYITASFGAPGAGVPIVSARQVDVVVRGPYHATFTPAVPIRAVIDAIGFHGREGGMLALREQHG